MLTSGGTVFVVGGSLCLANSLFNILEISKVTMDIRDQIKRLQRSVADIEFQNGLLKENNNTSRENNEIQARENKRLSELLERSDTQVEKLQQLQKQISIAKNDFEAESKRLRDENINLSSSVEDLRSLQSQYEKEITELKLTVSQLETQVGLLENLKQTFSSENTKLAEQVNKQSQIIVEAKQLIHNLAKFGDNYTSFHETLGHDIDRLEGTSDHLDTTTNVLHKLVETLKAQTFDRFDINNDGVITKEEFEQGIKNL